MSTLNQSQTQAFTQQIRDREMELRKIVYASFLDADIKTYSEVAGRALNIGEHSLADLLSDLHIIQLEKEVTELADVEAANGVHYSRNLWAVHELRRGSDIERPRVCPAANQCTQCQVRQKRMAKDMMPSLDGYRCAGRQQEPD